MSFFSLCRSVRFVLDSLDGVQQLDRTAVGELLARIRTSGLRVTPTTAPAIHRSVERVTLALELPTEPEVYVVSEPQANAFAPILGEGERPFVVLNSGIVTLLGPTELEFAIGHELGHFGHRHGSTHEERPSRSVFDALQERSRQRCAEVSADRIGLLCTRSVFTAARVMVKLASGLPDDHLLLDVEAFLEQLERRPEEASREWELSTSHPALPLRLWALIRFSESREYGTLAGQASGGRRLAEVEKEIALRFGLLGDGRLGRMEEHALQRALMWLALAMVMADDLIEAHERRALESLVGPQLASKALRYGEAHGRMGVRRKLNDSLRSCSSMPAHLRQRIAEGLRSFATTLGTGPESAPGWEVVKTWSAD